VAPSGYPKVPVDVAATGPRVVQIAVRLADQITFAAGADPTRVRWPSARGSRKHGKIVYVVGELAAAA